MTIHVLNGAADGLAVAIAALSFAYVVAYAVVRVVIAILEALGLTYSPPPPETPATIRYVPPTGRRP